jgi:hypothetical protein
MWPMAGSAVELNELVGCAFIHPTLVSEPYAMSLRSELTCEVVPKDCTWQLAAELLLTRQHMAGCFVAQQSWRAHHHRPHLLDTPR